MSLTYDQAVDEMFALFRTAWNANTAAIVGTVPEVRWQGVESKVVPIVDGYWCRISTQNLGEKQTTFKSAIAQDTNRRYTSKGLLFVQIFCPMSDSDSMSKGRQLGEVAKKAFRGKATPAAVWFRNARVNDLPPEDDMYRFNMVVEYEYDDIG